jgi:hypothetical protein
MSIFPSTVESLTRLNNVLSISYIVALVVGALSSAGIIYCGNRLQTAANVQIAQANENAALASQRAEELQKENLQIRKDMADRFLTEDEKKMMIGAGGRGRVMTITFIADREATDYARLLEAAFKAGGWNVGRQYRQQYDPDPTPHGVICRISQNPDVTVKGVITALERVRANPRMETVPNVRPDFLEIVVGSKPKA